MLEWLKNNKKIIAAIGAAVAAGAGALGYACPEPLAKLWQTIMGAL